MHICPAHPHCFPTHRVASCLWQAGCFICHKQMLQFCTWQQFLFKSEHLSSAVKNCNFCPWQRSQTITCWLWQFPWVEGGIKQSSWAGWSSISVLVTTLKSTYFSNIYHKLPLPFLNDLFFVRTDKPHGVFFKRSSNSRLLRKISQQMGTQHNS